MKMKMKKLKYQRFVVVINEPLHRSLKAKADREGRVMQRMVEDKLSELLEPQQLELAEVAK